VAVISIDDGKANALSPDVLSAIGEAFDKAEADGATRCSFRVDQAGSLPVSTCRS